MCRVRTGHAAEILRSFHIYGIKNLLKAETSLKAGITTKRKDIGKSIIKCGGIMVHQGVSPEDILPEDENYVVISGIRVRKGTIGAALRNASILASPMAGQTEKKEAEKIIAELAPALVVLGMYDHVVWKNPDIQKVIEAAAEKLQEKK